jgi:hypothetical protein
MDTSRAGWCLATIILSFSTCRLLPVSRLGKDSLIAPRLEKSLYRIRSQSRLAGIEKETILLGLILVLAAFLRLGFIGRQSIWVDEAIEAGGSTAPGNGCSMASAVHTGRCIFVLRLFLPLGARMGAAPAICAGRAAEHLSVIPVR